MPRSYAGSSAEVAPIEAWPAPARAVIAPAYATDVKAPTARGGLVHAFRTRKSR